MGHTVQKGTGPAVTFAVQHTQRSINSPILHTHLQRVCSAVHEVIVFAAHICCVVEKPNTCFQAGSEGGGPVKAKGFTALVHQQ